MVVIAVIGLVLPVLFSLVFSIMNAQLKVLRLSQVKNEGDFALSAVENIVRNKTVKIYQGDCTNYAAYSTYTERCASGSDSYSDNTGGDKFCLLDDDGHGLYYSVNSSKISSNSAITNATSNLTTSNTTISNFSISCSRAGDYSSPIVSVAFDICYGTAGCSGSRAEETASMHYQTAIKLHNY